MVWQDRGFLQGLAAGGVVGALALVVLTRRPEPPPPEPEPASGAVRTQSMPPMLPPIAPLPDDVVARLRQDLRAGGATRAKAREEVFRHGAASLPLLTELLQDAGSPDPAERAALCDLLGNMGPAAFIATPVLVALEGDDDESVRLKATAALSRVQPSR